MFLPAATYKITSALTLRSSLQLCYLGPRNGKQIHASSDLPADGDAYLLKAVVHDWNDEHAVKILTNCRTVMAPTGRVLVGEAVFSSDNVPPAEAFIDLTMLLYVHGRERTNEEFRELFHRSGLRLVETSYIEPGLSLLQAIAS